MKPGQKPGHVKHLTTQHMLRNFSLSQHFSFLPKVLAIVMLTLMSCQDEGEVKRRPDLTAQAGPDQSVLINTEVILDGSASTTDDDDALHYQWTLQNKPAGSHAIIHDATSPVASLTPDHEGVYTILLTISQGSFSDADEMHIVVTKTSEEPQTIIIDEDLDHELVLENIFEDPALPDYIVTADVRITAPVTIAPGVVIQFEQDKSLQIILGGALIAEGTAAQPITFTGTVKQTGHWKGLMFASNSSLNTLQYTIVEYGGSSELPESPRTNISVPGDAISGSVLNISHSIIRYSGGFGLYVGGMSHLGEFNTMEFTDNTKTAVYCSPRNASRLDAYTTFLRNGFDGVETGGMLYEGAPLSWTALVNGAYRITSDLTIASPLVIDKGAVFTISPNVLITVAPEGSLIAQGTADSKIIFESTGTLAQSAWRGIVFRSGHENIMEHSIINNAGAGTLPGMENTPASIGVVAGARLTITNSLLEKSTGWGIALSKGAYYNEDIYTGNTFVLTTLGSVKFPEQPQPVTIAGEWVDEFSFYQGNFLINENFYNRQTGQWFEGADNPWDMSPKSGFGLKIDAAGNYVWTIAMRHQNVECIAWSAEHLTGHVAADGQSLHFEERTWRSKYVNSCAPDENIDMDVQPGEMILAYTITKEYNVWTGEAFWVLSINSGGQVFKLYKK